MRVPCLLLLHAAAILSVGFSHSGSLHANIAALQLTPCSRKQSCECCMSSGWSPSTVLLAAMPYKQISVSGDALM